MKKPNATKVLELYKEIENGLSYVEAWARYYVSDNAVRKWFKTAWLPLIKKKVIGLLPFTCSQCAKKGKREHNDFYVR